MGTNANVKRKYESAHQWIMYIHFLLPALVLSSDACSRSDQVCQVLLDAPAAYCSLENKCIENGVTESIEVTHPCDCESLCPEADVFCRNLALFPAEVPAVYHPPSRTCRTGVEEPQTKGGVGKGGVVFAYNILCVPRTDSVEANERCSYLADQTRSVEVEEGGSRPSVNKRKDVCQLGIDDGSFNHIGLCMSSGQPCSRGP